MKQKRMFRFLTVLSLLAFTAMLANAQPLKEKRGSYAMAECQFNQMPGLTDQQQSKLDGLAISHQKAMNKLRLDMDVLQTEYQRLITSENQDRGIVQSNVEARAAVKKEMMAEQVTITCRLGPSLTMSKRCGSIRTSLTTTATVENAEKGRGMARNAENARIGRQPWQGRGWPK
ncbi:MAG: hypothetical protein HC896_09430 [Bacteroidales bacterium]|nr:hypothetical protein [Bacteroidales bacterium]